jgi:hypothetical protein
MVRWLRPNSAESCSIVKSLSMAVRTQQLENTESRGRQHRLPDSNPRVPGVISGNLEFWAFRRNRASVAKSLSGRLNTRRFAA